MTCLLGNCAADTAVKNFATNHLRWFRRIGATVADENKLGARHCWVQPPPRTRSRSRPPSLSQTAARPPPGLCIRHAGSLIAIDGGALRAGVPLEVTVSAGIVLLRW